MVSITPITPFFFCYLIISGTIIARGGSPAQSGTPGGPGTIFIKDPSSGFKKLIINNGKLTPAAQSITGMAGTAGTFAWLMEPNQKSYLFDEVQIYGSGGLAMEPMGSSSRISFYFIICSLFITNLTKQKYCSTLPD